MRRLWKRLLHRGHALIPWLIVILCLGTLGGLLAQISSETIGSIQSRVWKTEYLREGDVPLLGSWSFASAHANVNYLVGDRQRNRFVSENALMLVAKSATPSLILILPLLALVTAASLGSRLGAAASPRSRATAHCVLHLGIPLVVGALLAVESRVLGIPSSSAEWGRVLVWLGFVGLYFAAFSHLGTWISRRIRGLSRVVWIVLALFVTMFMIQTSRELVMRFDGSQLPHVPELPAEVRLSLFLPGGEPRVTRNREAVVADYLASVDAYSQAVHDVVARRYQWERGWHLFSPQLALEEISNQLLQTEWANVIDVIASSNSAQRTSSLAASLTSALPEAVWLVLLCSLAGVGAWMSGRKKDGSP